VACVSAVDLGAGGAAHLTARTARFEKDPIGQRGAREAHPATSDTGRNDAAPQTDRMPAPGASVTLRQELVELAMASVAHESFEHCVVLRIHVSQGRSRL
jgi:hypothetical protein